MKQTLFLLVLVVFMAISACIPLEKNKPVNPDTPAQALWQKVSSLPVLNQNIRGLHITPFEMYVLSNSQFIRFDDKLNVQELRNLPSDRQILGVPAMSDNTFARMYQNTSGKYILEFRLARNSSVLKTFSMNSLVDSVRSESFRVETPIKQMGCFSEDGTQFLLTGVIAPSNKVSAMIFDIQLDVNGTAFTRLELKRRVTLTDLVADAQGLIESVRSFNGNFFLATKNGGFRIAPNGVAYKLFSHWTKDFFPYNGRYYSSAFNNYDFQVSFDNGQAWRNAGSSSDCQFVVNANNKIFSQKVPLQPFGLADSTLLRVKTITFPTELKVNTADPSEFDIVFFKGRYYASNGKNLYSAASFEAK